ncbi:MAG: polysaccharide deacetylase family protein [Christensenellaceae bacterium]|jgi:peptidoglycan/xylan/chitin deacetylase (PgdA/CDA1 family)|nr:polysaccharide deacetylase family protein [Christensenellaceae bacterium]
MHKFANVIICGALAVLSVLVFTLNLDKTYVGITAPLYNGNPNKNYVSIMINVYDDFDEVLPNIISTLKNAKASATFFVGGVWVMKNHALLQQMSREFEIGNHGYTHADLNIADENKIRSEILNTHALVKSITGVEMTLFAPPSMAYNKTTVKVAESLNYKTILRTQGKDTIDWRDQDEQLIFQRATKDIKNGDLILMHPTKATAAVLARILSYYLEKGFQIVSVSKNIGDI